MVVEGEGRSFSGWIDNWWLFALRGVFALLFGVLALARPLAALVAIVLLFGVWAFVDGVSALMLAFSGRRRSWQLVVVGLIGVAAGALTFFWPGLTAIGLYAAVAVWSIVRGLLEVVLAIELRKRIDGEVWLIVGGIVSVLFGLLMIALPLAGLLALAWLIGVYALIFGVLMFLLASRLHGLKSPHRTPPIVMTPPLR